MMSTPLLFEDQAILVVAKRAGQIVHPAPGFETGTLTDELVAHCPAMRGVGSAARPGVVHRLDRETSGVMVFAKTQAAYLNLRRQFESHREVKKIYLALCHGAPKPPKGTIDSPVGRDRLRALSHYEVLARKSGVSLVKFEIETGRMHQIRIHAAQCLGCPIVGDPLYGSRDLDRHLRVKPAHTLLHAVELSFLHPTTARRVTFSTPPPDDFVYAI